METCKILIKNSKWFRTYDCKCIPTDPLDPPALVGLKVNHFEGL